jgi:ATP synthase I chain
MTPLSVRSLYWLTASFGIIGFVSYFALEGPRSAFGFGAGAAISFGNLWLFNWLSGALAPVAASRRNWQAGLFVGRYLILFTFGYVIVKALGVNPLALVLGLLASTAAVIISITLELLQSLVGNRRTH